MTVIYLDASPFPELPWFARWMASHASKMGSGAHFVLRDVPTIGMLLGMKKEDAWDIAARCYDATAWAIGQKNPSLEVRDGYVSVRMEDGEENYGPLYIVRRVAHHFAPSWDDPLEHEERYASALRYRQEYSRLPHWCAERLRQRATRVLEEWAEAAGFKYVDTWMIHLPEHPDPVPEVSLHHLGGGKFRAIVVYTPDLLISASALSKFVAPGRVPVGITHGDTPRVLLVEDGAEPTTAHEEFRPSID